MDKLMVAAASAAILAWSAAAAAQNQEQQIHPAAHTEQAAPAPAPEPPKIEIPRLEAAVQSPPPQTSDPAPAQSPAVPPAVLSDAASGAFERRDSLPNVNVYLPEGEASIRLRKLIRNVLFESQIDYEFVNGDISTFLRYKYYARNYTYRIGVFDSIEFPDVGSSSEDGFERVRGGLLLVGVPRDFNNRYFFLLENDRLTFGDVDRPDDRKNNIYAKIGYQFGTQFDERMNAIVGEERGRLTPVLTAFREIGPQRTGLAAALTQGIKAATGDYAFTKLEAEGLRRFDLTQTSFVFSRLHVGAFLARDTADTLPEPRDRDGDGVVDPIPRWEHYDLPQYELFRLGGREALKSVSTDESSIGTHELHWTNELFVPIFRNRNYKLGPLRWNTLYGIGYVGAGTVGFSFNEMVQTDRGVVDVGLGTESAITYRDWDVYLTVIVAHTVVQPDVIDGGTRVRFSVRTVR